MPVRSGDRRNLAPRNRRTVTVAQNAIQRVAPLAQEQYTNAINVNGYDAIIYNRLDKGRKCSCSKIVKVSPTILDEQGNATQEHINSMLNGSRFGIKDYNTQFSENPDYMAFDSEQVDPKNVHREDLNSVRPEDNYVNTTTSIEEPNDFIPEEPIGGETTGKCNVCYGSGFVGGYNVFNGIRIVLDTTYFELPANKIANSDMSNVSILKTEYPWKFEFNGPTSYVVFETIIPKNVVSLDSLRLFDNFKQLTSYTLQIKNISDVSYVTLNSSNILNFATGLPVQIKISGINYLTHIELQFNSTSVITKVEYPRLTKTGDLSVLNAIESVQLVVSPHVSDVQPWDIIIDNVFGKIWRVTSSNWFNDNVLNIHGWDIQARLVQEYEMQFNMTVRKTQKKPTTNFNR